MRDVRTAATGWIIAALAACGGAASPPTVAPVAPIAPPPAPLPLDRDLPRLVTRSLAMYQDVAAALAATPTDCAAATARLDQLAARYREVVAANARVIRDGRAAELRAALAPRDAELGAAAAAVIHAPALAACASEPAFGRALDGVFSPP